MAEVRGQPDQEAAQPVRAQFGQEGGRKIWSLILQNYGSPEGRGNNPRANKDEKDAQGREEGGRRGRKRGSPDQNLGLPLQRQQHCKPAPPSSDLTKLSPFGTTDSWSFQDHHNFPRETP